MHLSNSRSPDEDAREWLDRVHAERVRVVQERQEQSYAERARKAAEGNRDQVREAGQARLQEIDAGQLAALDAQHTREQARLEELLSGPEGQRRTGAQLARAALDPITAERSQQVQRTATKEFNRQGSLPPGDAGFQERVRLEDTALAHDLADLAQRPLTTEPAVMRAWEAAKQQQIQQQRAQEAFQRLAQDQSQGRKL